MKKLIILDLDGTLYTFDDIVGTSFSSSKFYESIKNNAYLYISKKLNMSFDEAQIIYQKIKTEFNGEISIGMESKFKIDRYEWFENTWNVEPSEFISRNDMNYLIKSLNSEIVILTAAPRVWAEKVLDYLNLGEYKSKLFTGETDIRKPNPLAFKQIIDRFKIDPSKIISVGDQVSSDILPAKSLGIKTILVGGNSKEADLCINNIGELPQLLREITK